MVRESLYSSSHEQSLERILPQTLAPLVKKANNYSPCEINILYYSMIASMIRKEREGERQHRLRKMAGDNLDRCVRRLSIRKRKKAPRTRNKSLDRRARTFQPRGVCIALALAI